MKLTPEQCELLAKAVATIRIADERFNGDELVALHSLYRALKEFGEIS